MINDEWFAVINILLIFIMILYIYYMETKYDKKFLDVMSRRDKYLKESLKNSKVSQHD